MVSGMLKVEPQISRIYAGLLGAQLVNKLITGVFPRSAGSLGFRKKQSAYICVNLRL
jgi:hypothetical protein